jgi:hypothetical protein
MDAVARLFTFVKDESYLLGTWIPYHGSLFGFDNLYLVDQGSSDGSHALYEKFRARGLRVHRTRLDLRHRAAVLTRLMRRHRRGARVLISLDADEFVCLDKNGGVHVDKADILRAIAGLPADVFKYRLGYFDAVNDAFASVDPLTEMRRFLYTRSSGKGSEPRHVSTCFDAAHFVATDDSNSEGRVDRRDDRHHCSPLMLLHFEVRGLDHFIWKNVRGATAWGHDRGSGDGRGVHYRDRYRAILAGRAREAFERDFYRPGAGQVSDVFAAYIRTLDRG